MESEIIISRSGYSTIMDLQKLQSKAIFVPTPGQTEQEYLANYLKEKRVCFYQKQNDFDLNKAINESKNYHGFVTRHVALVVFEKPCPIAIRSLRFAFPGRVVY